MGDRSVGGIGAWPVELVGVANSLFTVLTPGQIEIVRPSGAPAPPPPGGGGGVPPLTTYDSTVLATSHVAAYWPLSETSGSTAHDVLGGVNGTYTGGFTLGQAGAGTASRGVLLDGTSGYVTIPNAPVLDLPAAEQFSYEVWFRLTTAAFATNQAFISKVDTNLGTGYGVEALAGDGTLDITVADSDGVSNFGGSTNFLPWSFDTSHHYLAVVIDPTFITIYQDGSQVFHSSNGLLHLSTTNTQPLSIGFASAVQDFLANAPTYFGGLLQRVALYDGLLSSGDVASHWTVGTT